MLIKALEQYCKEKKAFSLRELKKKFPKERETIKNLCFLGLIEPVNVEFPDTVRSLIRTQQSN